MSNSPEVFRHNNAKSQLTSVVKQQIQQEQRLKRARLLYEQELGRQRKMKAKQDFTQQIRKQSEELTASLSHSKVLDQQALSQKQLQIAAINGEKQLIRMQQDALYRQRREAYEQAKEDEMHRWWKIQDHGMADLQSRQKMVSSSLEQRELGRKRIENAQARRREQLIQQREREARELAAKATEKARILEQQRQEEERLAQKIAKLRAEAENSRNVHVESSTALTACQEERMSANGAEGTPAEATHQETA